MRIGVSGDSGSFSEEAGLIYAAKANLNPAQITYLMDMEGVLAALTRGEIELGVFPFMNYTSGIVWPAFRAMGKHNFTPIDDIQLNVEQCLIAQSGTELNQIREVYSYTPAFEQCKIFLDQHNFRLIDWGDTASAARALADGLLGPNAAVVASVQAARQYKLKLLKRGIQDTQPNITRFMIVKSG